MMIEALCRFAVALVTPDSSEIKRHAASKYSESPRLSGTRIRVRLQVW
jgi:hypothetical protein